MRKQVGILHLITDLSTGGAQTALLRLLTGLNRERFAPAVACLFNGDQNVAQQIRNLGISVIDLGMKSRWRWDGFWRLYRLLRREKPRILHTWMFHANLAGRLLGRMARVPVIITSRRNVNIGGAWRERIQCLTAHLDDRVVAVCESARQAELACPRIPPHKVVTIYNGIDPAPFVIDDAGATAARTRASWEIPPGAPLLGTVGRLHPQKGFDDLLFALAMVRKQHPTVRLLLVGDGELRADLQSVAQSVGVSRGVIFAGHRTDIPAILAAIDIFVLPSLWEGMPNVVLEAMAAGLPVVATAVGGTPEVVEHETTGLLAPPRDPAALAEAISLLLVDPERARRMGEAGRARVETAFTMDANVRRMEALYEQLLRDKERERRSVDEKETSR